MSSATLTGVALLQNARKADCSSTIADARFRLASGTTSSNGPRELVAALCLTHADDKSPDLEGFFVVRAEVCTEVKEGCSVGLTRENPGQNC